MNSHKNARLTALGRAELVRRVVDHGQPASQVAASFDVCVKTVRKWLARSGNPEIDDPVMLFRLWKQLSASPHQDELDLMPAPGKFTDENKADSLHTAAAEVWEKDRNFHIFILPKTAFAADDLQKVLRG